VDVNLGVTKNSCTDVRIQELTVAFIVGRTAPGGPPFVVTT
jgi:hypothetical protein